MLFNHSACCWVLAALFLLPVCVACSVIFATCLFLNEDACLFLIDLLGVFICSDNNACWFINCKQFHPVHTFYSLYSIIFRTDVSSTNKFFHFFPYDFIIELTCFSFVS